MLLIIGGFVYWFGGPLLLFFSLFVNVSVYVSLCDFVCFVLLLPFRLGFYLFFFFPIFFPFLLRRVDGRVLVLQPGVKPEPPIGRAESRTSDQQSPPGSP